MVLKINITPHPLPLPQGERGLNQVEASLSYQKDNERANASCIPRSEE
jgi:hypothetical protein